jgi:hypothetical protein
VNLAAHLAHQRLTEDDDGMADNTDLIAEILKRVPEGEFEIELVPCASGDAGHAAVLSFPAEYITDEEIQALNEEAA